MKNTMIDSKKSILFLMSLFYYANVFGAVIGSDTAVTRFNNNVTLNDGDRIGAFTALFGGFTLLDAKTTGIFDSIFPVSGDFSLSGGDLVLRQDLIFNNILDVRFLGNIFGNGHRLGFPTIERIPSAIGVDFRCSPFFIDEITLASDAETLSWSFNETYLSMLSDDGLLRIFGFDGDILTFETSIDTGGAAFDGVGQCAFRPNSFTIGIARESGSADEVATYSFVPPATLTLINGTGLTDSGRACSWHPSGNFLAVGSLVAAGEVRIYPVADDGTIDTAGVVTFDITPDRDVYYECIAWNKAGTYLAVGLVTDGANPEILILEVNTSPLSIVGINASATPGKSVGGLDWGKGPDFLAVALQGTTGDNIQVYEHDDGGGGVGAGALTLLDSNSDLARTVEGISWEFQGGCFSVSTDEIGGNAFFNTYAFENNVLRLISSFEFTGLGAGDDFEATRWGPTGGFAAVSGDNDSLRTYGLPVNACYTWSNLTITHKSSTIFSDVCITFTGENVWNGRGACIEFESTATVALASNSSMMFRDMNLIGLEGDNISAADTTSTVTLNNVNVLLSEDLRFGNAKLDILNDVRISGPGTSFIFSSTVPITIYEDSRLIIDKEVTFRYQPAETTRSGIQFVDATSELVFDSAQFSTSSFGVQFINGTISFDGLCTMINEGSSDATSIEFGNGLGTNNPCIQFFPATRVELEQGFLRYNHG